MKSIKSPRTSNFNPNHQCDASWRFAKPSKWGPTIPSGISTTSRDYPNPVSRQAGSFRLQEIGEPLQESLMAFARDGSGGTE